MPRQIENDRWLFDVTLALCLLAVSAYIALTTQPRLGLDLRGGTQIVLETRDSPTVEAGRESTDRAVEVLRRRVDALGVSEPTLTRSGDRRIIVELPGVQDPREAAAVIKYREQNGRFKTIDDLKKVPGLDFKKIESRRDAIAVM